jgi:hypothetical protein
MDNTEQEIQQKICDDVTQIQAEMGITVRRILQQAGGKIGLQQQAAIQREVECTKRSLERFKSPSQ